MKCDEEGGAGEGGSCGLEAGRSLGLSLEHCGRSTGHALPVGAAQAMLGARRQSQALYLLAAAGLQAGLVLVLPMLCCTGALTETQPRRGLHLQRVSGDLPEDCRVSPQSP